MPSLHAAYPLIVWFSTVKVFPNWHLFFLAFALLTGFAAVYLCHHYVIDVLLGYVYASVAYFGVDIVCSKVEEKDENESK